MTVKKNEISSLFQVTELELIYRNKVPSAERKSILNSGDAYNILITNWDMNRIQLVEDFKIVLLDRGSYCLGISEIARGGMTSCMVDPRLVFATALKGKASSLILAHNHPSGNIKPSPADIKLTKQLAEGGSLLDIKVVEHLIVVPETYYSMRDHDLIQYGPFG